MVLSSILYKSKFFVGKQDLVVITNEITDEILNEIGFISHIVFQVPIGSSEFDFDVSLLQWKKFSCNLISLEFNGMFINKQFTTQHLEDTKLQHLVIGKSDYPLFDGEDITRLPMIAFVNLCNYVASSKNLDTWTEKLTLQGNNVYGYRNCCTFYEFEKYPSKRTITNIDISGSTNLLGLINIIKNNTYDEKVKYNIDLKALHNIKDELSKINDMIGMDDLKNQILEQLLYFIQGLHINEESDYKHTVIFGPPGTGKTEIAKLIGMMYSKLGVLKNNVFKKVTRSDLIGGYTGQTAIKTSEVIKACLGGVLFIDEVYSLGTKSDTDSYPKECIDTLCEALSFHKSDLMVIIAGYEKEIEECFFKVNKGLPSRFIWRFYMKEYNANQLMHIFISKIDKNKWSCDKILITEQWFEEKKYYFKNFGRDMELLFTYTKICHGKRIFGKPCIYRKIITIEDLENGFTVFLKNIPQEQTIEEKMIEEKAIEEKAIQEKMIEEKVNEEKMIEEKMIEEKAKKANEEKMIQEKKKEEIRKKYFQ